MTKRMGRGLWITFQFSIVTILGPSALGYITGYLTGLFGGNQTVYAAVIPAIISLVGLTALSGVGTNNGLAVRATMSLGLLTFSLALSFGHVVAIEDSDIIKSRGLMLERCSSEQARLNEFRKGKGLEPITLEKLCPD